jgi:hypothetical protein
MAIVKLANAGESVTWRIKKAETTAGKFGPQVKFENDKGDILYISEETAGRQLGRIPLDIANCAGELLVFSRDENPKGGAPYWSIRLADAVDRAAPQQSKRIPPPSKVIKGLDDIDLPEGPYAPDAQNYPVRQGNMPDLSDAPLPPEPEWVQTKASSVAPKTEAKLAMARAYLDLLGWVRADQPKLSDEAAQAAAATIWISWGQAGLR